MTWKVTGTALEILPKFKEVIWRWTHPFQDWFNVRVLGLDTVNQCTKFEVFISIIYEDMKGVTKCRK